MLKERLAARRSLKTQYIREVKQRVEGSPRAHGGGCSCARTRGTSKPTIGKSSLNMTVGGTFRSRDKLTIGLGGGNGQLLKKGRSRLGFSKFSLSQNLESPQATLLLCGPSSEARPEGFPGLIGVPVNYHVIAYPTTVKAFPPKRIRPVSSLRVLP